ncbi:MAG: hypothetical protein HYU63_00415, partial [Armatimonadetes bacterium]|nr:hypothetical protein [Armatimonadota bacterium]
MIKLWGHFKIYFEIKQKKEKGFNLVEIIVSLLIILFGVLAVLGLFTNGLNYKKKAQNYFNCILLAQRKMEEILYQSSINFTLIQGKFEQSFSDYSYNIEKKPYGVSGINANYEKIEVLVYEPSNTNASISSLRAITNNFQGTSSDTYALVNWIADQSNNKVWYYNGSSLDENTPAGLGKPSGIACDSSAGFVWVADQSNNKLWKYDGAIWTSYTPPGLGSPAGIAADSYAQVLWIADQYNNKIWYYDPTAVPQLTDYTPAGLGKPSGIACDSSAGFVWVADQSNNKLWKYDGAGWTSYTPPGLGSPAGIAVDSYAQVLWIADQYNNKIWYYDPTAVPQLTDYTP